MSERTEEPTPKRLSEARDRGQVASSRDAVAVAAMGAGLAAAFSFREDFFRVFRALFLDAARVTSDGAGSLSPPRALGNALALGLQLVLPPVAAACGAAALVGALCTGFLFAPRAALPRLDRVDVAAALGRMAKPSTWAEAFVKLVAAGLIAYLAVDAARGSVGAAAQLASSSAGAWGFAAVSRGALVAVATRAFALCAGWALLDLLYRRHQHTQQLRMTREEVSREHRESEGDPHTKSAREALRHELANEAAIDAVRKASFVVTNPTHYAVALAWDADTMEAPELIAKGRDAVAQKMIAEARRAGVPVLRAAPLARSLHELELREPIPEALFDAVAAVVAFLEDGGDPEQFEP